LKRDSRRRIKRRIIFEAPRVTLYRDTIVLAGKRRFRDWVRMPGVGAVVVLTARKKIVLVRQYRYGAHQTLWEIPAGTCAAGESPRKCALRECEEETGFKPGKLESLGFYLTSPAGSDERVHLFLATRLKKTRMNPDPDEMITAAAFSVRRIRSMLRDGTIRDAKTIIALHRFFSLGDCFARLRRARNCVR